MYVGMLQANFCLKNKLDVTTIFSNIIPGTADSRTPSTDGNPKNRFTQMMTIENKSSDSVR